MIDADRLHAGSDEDLARDAGAGSVAAFDALARRMQSPLVGFLTRRLPTRADAEDVAQDALIRAYQSLPAYREQGRFKPWLFTIAYRLAASRLRGVKKTVAMPHHVSDDRHDPLEALDHRERGERVWSIARSLLSDEQVSALWLHYVEEMPVAEIAKVLGRSRVSVKTMMHRARKRLATRLTIDEGGAR